MKNIHLFACVFIQFACIIYLLDKLNDDHVVLLSQHNALAGITRSGGPANMQPVLDWGKTEAATDIPLDVNINDGDTLTIVNCRFEELEQ